MRWPHPEWHHTASNGCAANETPHNESSEPPATTNQNLKGKIMKTHANFTSLKERVVAALAAVCVSAVLFTSVGVGFDTTSTVANVNAAQTVDAIVVTATRLV
jgi:hypothetical protein